MRNNPLALVILLVGVLLLILGIAASDSVASSFSKFFSGTPSDRSVWLMIAGVVGIGIGSALTWRGSRA